MSDQYSPKTLDHIQQSPLTAIDKSIALAPLMQLCKITGDTKRHISDFKKEYRLVYDQLKGNGELSKRTQARIYYMLSQLLLVGNGDVTIFPPSSIILEVVKIAEEMSSDSIDFNTAIPMENGLWGIECCSVVVLTISKSEFLEQNKKMITHQIVEGLNEMSVFLKDLNDMNSLRTKNSISRNIATLMNDVLSVNPTNMGDLQECFKTFKSLIVLLISMITHVGEAN